MSGFEDPVGRWNGRYAAEGYLFGTAPNDTLAANAGRFAAGDRVLCVADGEGRNSVFLAGLGCAVTAFDPSEVGLGKGRALAAERGVTVDGRASTVDDWPWDPASPAEAFDAVVAIFVQFATPAQRAAMFDGFGRALRPGGLLLLVGVCDRRICCLLLLLLCAHGTQRTGAGEAEALRLPGEARQRAGGGQLLLLLRLREVASLRADTGLLSGCREQGALLPGGEVAHLRAEVGLLLSDSREGLLLRLCKVACG